MNGFALKKDDWFCLGTIVLIPTRSRSAVFKQLCLGNMRCGIQYIGIIHRALTIRFFVAMVLPYG